MGHARALLPLEKVEQIKLAEEIIKKALSVRQVEALVERIKNRKKSPKNTIRRRGNLTPRTSQNSKNS